MLYVLAPVLVRVLLDGSGHDSAEIDGTVERHASSTPTKQPVPAPRHSTVVVKTSSDHNDLKLDLKSCSPKSAKKKSKIPEPVKPTRPLANNKIDIIENDKPAAKRKSLTNDDSNKLLKELESKVPEIDTILRENVVSYAQDSVYSNNDDEEEVACFTQKTVTTIKKTESNYDLDHPETDKEATSTSQTIVETVTTKKFADGKQESWRTMSSSGEASVPAELWESGQFAVMDVSPVSCNNDDPKNGSRQGTISDTDSDGCSPQRRRSSRRRTLGSSSGSDVALHEGAELSPMEDDQGTSLTANLLSKQCTYPAEIDQSLGVLYIYICYILIYNISLSYRIRVRVYI